MSHRMQARPLFDNVVIELKVLPKQTESGIHLPDSMEKEVSEGTVIAVGAGDDLPVSVQGIGGMSTLAKRQMRVNVGEYVIFKKYAGTPFKLNGKQVVGLNQKDIVTVIDK